MSFKFFNRSSAKYIQLKKTCLSHGDKGTQLKKAKEIKTW